MEQHYRFFRNRGMIKADRSFVCNCNIGSVSIVKKRKISTYFSVYINEKEVVIHYANTKELAQEFLFKLEEDAERFYQSCLDIEKSIENLSASKQEITHNQWVKQTLKDVDYEYVEY